MERINVAILNALKVNMGYKEGEKVAIIMQEWNPKFGEGILPKFEKAKELCFRMYEVFRENNVDVEIISYMPEEARSGVDATKDVYERIGFKEIIFMPTVFSLTHTNFRKAQTEKGSRIASMPGFILEMFEEGGPMDVDYNILHKNTEEIANKLRESRFVRIIADETDMKVEIDKELVHVSSGLLDKPGKYGISLERRHMLSLSMKVNPSDILLYQRDGVVQFLSNIRLNSLLKRENLLM
jgi:hypothetical protein